MLTMSERILGCCQIQKCYYQGNEFKREHFKQSKQFSIQQISLIFLSSSNKNCSKGSLSSTARPALHRKLIQSNDQLYRLVRLLYGVQSEFEGHIMIPRLIPNSRDSRLHSTNIRDFNYSLDIKGFVKETSNFSPFRNNNSKSFYKKSAQKPRIQCPSPLAALTSFSKNVSQKNIPNKKRRLSGLNISNSNNHSVSMDRHMLKQKYDNIQELINSQKYEKAATQIKHSILHFQYSNAQKNLYIWLVLSLMHLNKNELALEQVLECLGLYPQAYDAYLYASKIHIKFKGYRQAIDILQKAIKLDPKNQNGYIELSSCYHEMQENDKSVDLLIKAYQKFPKSSDIIYLLVQRLYENNQKEECHAYILKGLPSLNKRDSLFVYFRGLQQKAQHNINQAYILFQETLKFNNHKAAVTKALLEMLIIQIDQRDFYKAHHTISRAKYLQLQFTSQISLYGTFIEGAILMMKKKFGESILILSKILNSKNANRLKLSNVVYKYLGYGHFKLGEHEKSIKFYRKIAQQQKDQSSDYNLLLAEGIELVDYHGNYEAGRNKFQKAKLVYSQKVQPYIYIAMTIIKKFNVSKQNDQSKKVMAVIDALKELEKGYNMNSSSSNLLYHRTILHLYFEDWDQAQHDINRCIQKAEQNLPKYFYLRGVCFSCIKEFKKAINQYSICISLSPGFSLAYLQKSKCSFLLGDTEKGFSSLKIFMELNPDDLTIYRWIGDLLYEGESYRDALKAYSQLGQKLDLPALVMQLKCLFRMGTLNDFSALLKTVEKSKSCQKQKFNVDSTALGIIHLLVKGQYSKQLNLLVKKLNKYLEQNIVGYIFQLIDCMNLLGVASFYLQKYVEAYQSFLLVLQLFKSLSSKSNSSLKSENSEEVLDLQLQDIYLNLLLCEFAQGNVGQATRLFSQEYYQSIEQPNKKKSVQKIIRILQKGLIQSIELEQRGEKPINSKLKKIQVSTNRLKIKSKPSFNLYHDSAVDVYASSVAQKIIDQLHAGYIDNMPQGPWIKRNTHGVIFTEEILQTDQSISFEDSSRLSQSKADEQEYQQSEPRQQSDKKNFLKKLQFDKGVEAKLNKIIQHSKKQSAS